MPVAGAARATTGAPLGVSAALLADKAALGPAREA